MSCDKQIARSRRLSVYKLTEVDEDLNVMIRFPELQPFGESKLPGPGNILTTHCGGKDLR